MSGEAADHLTIFQIPQGDGIFAAGAEGPPAIGRNRHRINRLTDSPEAAEELAAGHVPQANGLVSAAREGPATVGGNGHAPHPRIRLVSAPAAYLPGGGRKIVVPFHLRYERLE